MSTQKDYEWSVLAAWIADHDLARQVRARDRRRAEHLTLREQDWFRSPLKEMS